TNVYTMKWLPQNELLANPTIKLFITHGGINSIIESVYYAKPMIILPIAIDQHGNAAMAESKGYALVMSLSAFTSLGMVENVKSLLKNDSYKKAAEFYSLIMKDKLVKPEIRVSHLINHVIKYGDNHLKTSAYQLNWFQFFMFDIFLVFIL
ncbi:hypothetical protein HELRODRAFT_135418, partial [Helobdella robusta]|uniref:UDP-glucuronosyltransferase n=1 Tax=Helobdella robusta TaxID=6412 RepID=T1EI88_HELRO